MGIPRCVVVDVETTGLSPAYHDRIVEIAIVQVDQAGMVEQEWSTLTTAAPVGAVMSGIMSLCRR